MRAVRLEDQQIERYSRQIVLPEIGAEGQCRLLEARVAVVGTAPVAGELVAQLVAAGVGAIVAPHDLHGYVDPASAAQVTPLEAITSDDRFDIVALMDVVTPATSAPAATHTVWLADSRIGETPPCAACAARALPPTARCDVELASARASVLAAIMATEIIKRLVGVGTALAGHVLTYDPATADIAVTSVTPDPTCIGCATRPAED